MHATLESGSTARHMDSQWKDSECHHTVASKMRETKTVAPTNAEEEEEEVEVEEVEEEEVEVEVEVEQEVEGKEMRGSIVNL